MKFAESKFYSLAKYLLNPFYFSRNKEGYKKNDNRTTLANLGVNSLSLLGSALFFLIAREYTNDPSWWIADADERAAIDSTTLLSAVHRAANPYALNLLFKYGAAIPGAGAAFCWLLCLRALVRKTYIRVTNTNKYLLEKYYRELMMSEECMVPLSTGLREYFDSQVLEISKNIYVAKTFQPVINDLLSESDRFDFDQAVITFLSSQIDNIASLPIAAEEIRYFDASDDLKALISSMAAVRVNQLAIDEIHKNYPKFSRNSFEDLLYLAYELYVFATQEYYEPLCLNESKSCNEILVILKDSLEQLDTDFFSNINKWIEDALFLQIAQKTAPIYFLLTESGCSCAEIKKLTHPWEIRITETEYLRDRAQVAARTIARKQAHRASARLSLFKHSWRNRSGRVDLYGVMDILSAFTPTFLLMTLATFFTIMSVLIPGKEQQYAKSDSGINSNLRKLWAIGDAGSKAEICLPIYAGIYLAFAFLMLGTFAMRRLIPKTSRKSPYDEEIAHEGSDAETPLMLGLENDDQTVGESTLAMSEFKNQIRTDELVRTVEGWLGKNARSQTKAAVVVRSSDEFDSEVDEELDQSSSLPNGSGVFNLMALTHSDSE